MLRVSERTPFPGPRFSLCSPCLRGSFLSWLLPMAEVLPFSLLIRVIRAIRGSFFFEGCERLRNK